MRTKRGVESLFQRLYQENGGDPSELVQIISKDGGWHNALSYEVTRSDMKRARVYRRDLEDKNEQQIARSLRSFI
jgi:hypothetical protein